MSINLETDLIHKFRDKVNEEPIFRELYRNINGKNKWNIICSAMDWITVVSEGLPIINLTGSFDFRLKHLITLNLMQYIICVDLLVESIVQLYRVIFNTNNYPLFNNKDIFNQSKISDDKYFKHIRAVFSTHPVNLDSLDGNRGQGGEKFYASWISEDFFHKNDFNVFLYSNDPEKDDNYFGINIEDIYHYAEKRYQLLVPLIDKVNLILNEHRIHFKSKIIPTVDNIIEQLKILFEENKDRFGFNDGYANAINYLLRMMQVEFSATTDFDSLIVEEYKDFMCSLIPLIKVGLQNMKTDELTWKRTSTGYEFEKIYSYLSDHEHPIGKSYYKGLVIKGILPSYLLNCDNFDEKQLVLDAVLHKNYRTRLKAISYLELIGV